MIEYYYENYNENELKNVELVRTQYYVISEDEYNF